MLTAGSIIRGSFDFARRNVAVIAVWCVVYMVGCVLMGLLMRPMFEAQLVAMTAETPHVPEGLIGNLALLYSIVGIMLLVLFAAAFRAVLKPEQSTAAYLRLGMDELRLLGVMLALMIGGFLAMLLAGVAAGIVAAIIGFVLALVAGKAAIWIVVGLLYIAIFGAMIYLAVRLSPAAPLTILNGRIEIARAWRMTKGHFWPLFGAYISIALIVSIPFIILTTIMMGGFYHQVAVAPYDPAAFNTAMRAQMEAQRPGQPLWFFAIICSGLLGGIAIALQGAMTAIATRDLLAESEAA